MQASGPARSGPPVGGGAAAVIASQEAMTHAKVSAARLSVVSNALLVVLKLAVGLLIGSVAVLSEAIHSATDLIAALIAFFAVRAATRPPDEDHPFGHGKFEAVSGMAEALLIVGAGAYIVFEAIDALRHGREAPPFGWGLAVMLLSAAVNTLVARHLMRVARRADSAALEADGHHLLIDVWTSIGVVAGLLLVAATGWHWVDPVVALVVAVFIFATGWRIAHSALAPLLDTKLPDDEVRVIESVLQDDPRVLGWHKLRTRKAGSLRHVDVHIQLADDLSLREAHDVTEEVEDAVRECLPNVWVTIHTEPFEGEQEHHRENPH